MSDVFPEVAKGSIEASKQGGIQAISLAVTLGIALLGGVIVGRYHIPSTVLILDLVLKGHSFIYSCILFPYLNCY